MITIAKVIQLQHTLSDRLSGGWSVIINNGIIRITWVSNIYVCTLDIKDENDYEYNSLGAELSIDKFLDELEEAMEDD